MTNHPAFAERLVGWAEAASESTSAPVDALQEAWPQEKYIAFLHDWLARKNPQQVQYAIQRLRDLNRSRFVGPWSQDVAVAIGGPAETGHIGFTELRRLAELGDAAKPAIEQLVEFIGSRLDEPGDLLATIEHREGNVRLRARPMLQALEILGRFPSMTSEILPELKEALTATPASVDEQYQVGLRILIDAIEKSRP